MIDGRIFLLPSASQTKTNTSNSNKSTGICLTAKGGSTTLKRYLLGVLERRGVQLLKDWSACPHGHPAFRGLAPPTKSYMVVRHPAHRLVSAYHEVQTRGFWWRLPRGLEPNASFSSAVSALVQTSPRAINHHFRPLYMQCGLLSGRSYEILRYEQWDHLARTLADHFAPSQPPLAFREGSTRALADQMYTMELARLVNRWSKKDLTFFNYLPWLPTEAVRIRVGAEEV